jgi:hypothetical protein
MASAHAVARSTTSYGVAFPPRKGLRTKHEVVGSSSPLRFGARRDEQADIREGTKRSREAKEAPQYRLPNEARQPGRARKEKPFQHETTGGTVERQRNVREWSAKT